MSATNLPDRAAAMLAEQADDYLRPFVAAGVDPSDFVYEQGPVTVEHRGDDVVFSMSTRLRPKTAEERAAAAHRSEPAGEL